MRASPGTATSIVSSSSGSNIQDGVDSGIKATVFDYTSSNPLAVRLTDTGGDYVSLSTALLATSAKQDTQQTALDAIKTAVETLDNTVGGSELQVDVLTMPIVAVTQSGTWDEVGINDSGNSITVDNAGLTELAAAINASSQMDVNIAANGIGLLTTTAHDAAFGTAGTADTQVRSIQGIASMTPVQVSQATAATLNMTEASASGILTSVQLIDDTIFTDDTSTHSTGSTKVVGIGAVADPTDAAVTANDIGMPAMTTTRFLKVIGQANSGVDIGDVTLTANSGVDIGDVDVTSISAGDNNIGNVDIASIAAGDNNIGNVDIVSGTITTVTTVSTVSALGISTTGPQKAEDVAHASGDMGIAVWAVRDDTLDARSGTENDYEPFHTNANGALWTIGVDDATQTASLSVLDDWDNGASDGASVSGDVAHDGVDAGEPAKIGMKAYSPDGTTPGTAVAELDRTNAKGDLDGRLFVNTVHPRFGHKHLDGTAAYTDEALVADPGDGFQIIITSITFSSGEAVAINFFLEEGVTKIYGPIYIEAVAGRGFVSGPIHLPVTASTAVTLTTSAANDQSFDLDYYIQAV